MLLFFQQQTIHGLLIFLLALVPELGTANVTHQDQEEEDLNYTDNKS